MGEVGAYCRAKDTTQSHKQRGWPVDKTQGVLRQVGVIKTLYDENQTAGQCDG